MTSHKTTQNLKIFHFKLEDSLSVQGLNSSLEESTGKLRS